MELSSSMTKALLRDQSDSEGLKARKKLSLPNLKPRKNLKLNPRRNRRKKGTKTQASLWITALEG